MPLHKIEIHGFRGFQKLGSLDFAIPNGKSGSGLTVITGANNSGKSSIIEGLKAKSGNQTPSFSEGARNSQTNKVKFKYFSESEVLTIESIAESSSETIRLGSISEKIFVLPSRRAFNPYFGRSEWSREQFLEHTAFETQRSVLLSNFEYRLFNIQKNPAEFNKILKEVLKFEVRWSIDKSDQGSYFLKFFNRDKSHTSNGMGEGIISIFAIVDALYDSRQGDVIVIDEPELSLHPSLQKRVSNLLLRFSQDRQIIIATHSPYFIDPAAIENGAKIARVISSEHGSEIHHLSTESSFKIKSISESNRNNPHIFGLNARELFFQEDGIILTEGQEDVLFYPIIAKQIGVELGGSFFGWGAGGASNIKKICSVLKDLGFRKVAAILDGDQQNLLSELVNEFPSYIFKCIPAKDIRDKQEINGKNRVDGLLDGNRNLKPEYHESIKSLFGEISSYIDN